MLLNCVRGLFPGALGLFSCMLEDTNPMKAHGHMHGTYRDTAGECMVLLCLAGVSALTC